MEENKQIMEELSVKIHQLYCEQYQKDHGEPYWTNGDYSKLKEETKEYDRNIARFVLARDLAWQKKIEEAIGQNEEGERILGAQPVRAPSHVDTARNAKNQERSRLRSLLLPPITTK